MIIKFDAKSKSKKQLAEDNEALRAEIEELKTSRDETDAALMELADLLTGGDENG